jgi:hypothetical protein
MLLVASNSKTRPIRSETFWLPAFWGLKNLFGYYPVGFAPTLDGDVVYWAKKSTQPDGAANGSQPVRSETNRTSGAAGSRR